MMEVVYTSAATGEHTMSVKFEHIIMRPLKRSLDLGEYSINTAGIDAEPENGYLEIFNTHVNGPYKDDKTIFKEFNTLRNRTVLLPLDRDTIKAFGEYLIKLADNENIYKRY